MPLLRLETGDQFFDRVKLGNREVETLVEVVDEAADFVAAEPQGVQRPVPFEGLANAPERVRKGLQLRDLIFDEGAEHAQKKAQARCDNDPPVLQAEGLFLDPARRQELVQEDAGALARVAQQRAFILVETRGGMFEQNLPDDLLGVQERQSAG